MSSRTGSRLGGHDDNVDPHGPDVRRAGRPAPPRRTSNSSPDAGLVQRCRGPGTRDPRARTARLGARNDAETGESGLRRWLYRIATNACLDYLKSSTCTSRTSTSRSFAEVPWLEPYADSLLDDTTTKDDHRARLPRADPDFAGAAARGARAPRGARWSRQRLRPRSTPRSPPSTRACSARERRWRSTPIRSPERPLHPTRSAPCSPRTSTRISAVTPRPRFRADGEGHPHLDAAAAAVLRGRRCDRAAARARVRYAIDGRVAAGADEDQPHAGGDLLTCAAPATPCSGRSRSMSSACAMASPRKITTFGVRQIEAFGIPR